MYNYRLQVLRVRVASVAKIIMVMSVVVLIRLLIISCG